MTQTDDTLSRFLERYAEDRVPWADHAPPPEIAALTESLSPGRALDVGCGYGRAALHLAGQGWTAVGIDFVPQAIDEARRRAAAAGVAERVSFHVASAIDLSFLAPPFELVIDVGCMHSFDEAMLAGYRNEMARLLRSEGLYVLFAHLRDEEESAGDEGPRGIAEATIHALFAGLLDLERVERGMTQVEDRPPWRSGWFWFRRR